MAYCTQEHVEARNVSRGPYGASTKPTASQVWVHISQAAGVIDSHLYRAGYTVPVATVGLPTTTALFLQSINAVGACYTIEQSAQTSDRRKDFQAMWESALEMMCTINLAGMEKNNESALPRGGPSGAPYFSMDMQL